MRFTLAAVVLVLVASACNRKSTEADGNSVATNAAENAAAAAAPASPTPGAAPGANAASTGAGGSDGDQQDTGAADAAASPTPRDEIMGTWVLVAQSCCGPDAAEQGPWEPVPARGRTRVTFLRNGRFQSSGPEDAEGSWSVRGDALDGWLSYSVSFEVMGDTMIMFHQPTSSQNAYAERWRRVQT
jgi:hypothetical protein